MSASGSDRMGLSGARPTVVYGIEEVAQYRVFILSSFEDRHHRETLKRHLKPAERAQRLSVSPSALPGDQWKQILYEAMLNADVIVVLGSADLFAAEDMSALLDRAFALYASGGPWVIPVRLRACYWESTPFGGGPTFPVSGIPLVRAGNTVPDEEWTALVRSILELAYRRSMASRPSFSELTTTPAQNSLSSALVRDVQNNGPNQFGARPPQPCNPTLLSAQDEEVLHHQGKRTVFWERPGFSKRSVWGIYAAAIAVFVLAGGFLVTMIVILMSSSKSEDQVAPISFIPFLRPTASSTTYPTTPIVPAPPPTTRPVPWVRLSGSSVASSSSLPPNPPGYAFDDKSETAWCEGAIGKGDGEWITVKSPVGCKITKVRLTGGWAYDSPNAKARNPFGPSDMWILSNLASKLRVTWPGEPVGILETFTMADRGIKKDVILPRDVSEIRITIEAATKNQGGDNVCLDGLEIWGYCDS